MKKEELDKIFSVHPSNNMSMPVYLFSLTMAYVVIFGGLYLAMVLGSYLDGSVK